MFRNKGHFSVLSLRTPFCLFVIRYLHLSLEQFLMIVMGLGGPTTLNLQRSIGQSNVTVRKPI